MPIWPTWKQPIPEQPLPQPPTVLIVMWLWTYRWRRRRVDSAVRSLRVVGKMWVVEGWWNRSGWTNCDLEYACDSQTDESLVTCAVHFFLYCFLSILSTLHILITNKQNIPIYDSFILLTFVFLTGYHPIIKYNPFTSTSKSHLPSSNSWTHARSSCHSQIEPRSTSIPDWASSKYSTVHPLPLFPTSYNKPALPCRVSLWYLWSLTSNWVV